MLYNLALLSGAELQQLFISESNRFINGIHTLTFDELKQIRLHLRHVASELESRKIPYEIHNKLDIKIWS